MDMFYQGKMVRKPGDPYGSNMWSSRVSDSEIQFVWKKKKTRKDISSETTREQVGKYETSLEKLILRYF